MFICEIILLILACMLMFCMSIAFEILKIDSSIAVTITSFLVSLNSGSSDCLFADSFVGCD